MDFSLDILNTLISSPNHSYIVKSDVSKEIFQSFVNYLVDDQIPDITIENIHDYGELSDEFEILSTVIQAKKEEFGEQLVYINGLRFHHNSKNSSEYEKKISENLDLYIENYGSSLMKIPIQSLYNIFNHPMRQLTKYDAAYDEIKKEFSNSNNSSIFVLLESLDGTQMTRHNIEEMISLRNERNNFMARIDFSFISKLQKDQMNCNEKIESLENQIKKLHQIIENKNIEKQDEEQKIIEKVKIMIQNEMKLSELFGQNKLLKDDVEQLKKEIEQIKKDFVDMKNDYEFSMKKLSDENIQLKKDKEQAQKMTRIPLLFESNKEFNGIINYLINNGNIEEEINITSTPLCSSEEDDSAKHSIFYNSKKYFRTKNVVNAFICFDFKNKKITPTAYSIKTASNNSIRPSSWVIEVSNGSSTFIPIDEQNECESLNGYDRIQTFRIKDQSIGKFRYIRLRQTGPNWYDGSERNILVIGCIEFYGYLEISEK